jgi:DNA gyrase subunit A
VIRTIRESREVEDARTNLMKRFDLSELQANAILDMRLARLAALERKKIEDEYLSVIQLIAELEDILANPARVLGSSRTSSPS